MDLAPAGERIAADGQVVAARAGDAVVESHDDAAAETAQRDTAVGAGELFLGPEAGFVHGVERAGFVDELTGGGQVFADPIAGGPVGRQVVHDYVVPVAGRRNREQTEQKSESFH